MIQSLAEKYGRTPVQVILNWGLSRGYAVIPKSSTEERQAQNFASKDFKLADEDVEAITKKFDDGTLIFKAPGDNPYNVFA